MEKDVFWHEFGEDVLVEAYEVGSRFDFSASALKKAINSSR